MDTTAFVKQIAELPDGWEYSARTGYNARFSKQHRSVLASLHIGWASILIGLSAGYLRLLAVLTAGLLLLAFATFRLQSERVTFGLFKYASIYMLGEMVILALRAL